MPTAYITVPEGSATEIARALVAEGLAACVNAVDCHSTYRWEDDLVQESEVILLAKTTDERYDDLVARVADLHPYDVPCVERFDEEAVLPAYADWVEESVGD